MRPWEQAFTDPVHRAVEPGEEASPFSFDRYYAMSNARAERLGHRFAELDAWLPAAVDEELVHA